MKEELGSSFSFSIIWIIVMLTVIMAGVVFISDYYQVFNVKETVDTEFKRQVSEGLIEYANDHYSSDFIAKLEPDDVKQLEDKIRKGFVKKMKKDYDLNLLVDSVSLKDDGTIVCKYNGTVDYFPMIAYGKVNFPIKVMGRSRIQRFDMD